ncbi:hypothetical protein ACQP2X_34005 [Actinoplanes sp. CA-131856]
MVHGTASGRRQRRRRLRRAAFRVHAVGRRAITMPPG